MRTSGLILELRSIVNNGRDITASTRNRELQWVRWSSINHIRTTVSSESKCSIGYFSTKRQCSNAQSSWKHFDSLFPKDSRDTFAPTLLELLIYWYQEVALHLKPSTLNGGDLVLAILRTCILFGDHSALDFSSTNLVILFELDLGIYGTSYPLSSRQILADYFLWHRNVPYGILNYPSTFKPSYSCSCFSADSLLEACQEPLNSTWELACFKGPATGVV